MKKNFPSFATTALALALWGSASLPDAAATTYTVAMTPSYTFSPSYIEILPGDAIRWYNQDTFNSHEAMALNGSWWSGWVPYGGSASKPLRIMPRLSSPESWQESVCPKPLAPGEAIDERKAKTAG